MLVTTHTNYIVLFEITFWLDLNITLPIYTEYFVF